MMMMMMMAMTRKVMMMMMMMMMMMATEGMSDAGLGHQRNNGVIEGEPVSFSVS